MAKSIGFDVVSVGRIEAVVDDNEFLRQVFNEDEILKAPVGKQKVPYYALLFAVKEAMLKAIGCGLHRGSYWHDMEVMTFDEVNVSGVLLKMMESQYVSHVHLSCSHSEQYAVALVVLE